jgi:hypothetical protein
MERAVGGDGMIGEHVLDMLFWTSAEDVVRNRSSCRRARWCVGTTGNVRRGICWRAGCGC